jgi:hypothetical protein
MKGTVLILFEILIHNGRAVPQKNGSGAQIMAHPIPIGKNDGARTKRAATPTPES